MSTTAAVYDQFDVFKIPHSRMKQLVSSCNRSMDKTDFANNDDLIVLLDNLQRIFREFKNHEEIENEFIMGPINSKLKAMAIHNSAVCNCHKDDEFSPLFDLLESGYLFINKSKTISERINFGMQLRKALKHFTNRFVPHMKEEEEVFQPLLVQYFSPEELAQMKTVVIQLHLTKKKFSTLYMSGRPQRSANNNNNNKHHNQHVHRKTTVANDLAANRSSHQSHHKVVESSVLSSSRPSLNDMPDELLHKMFSYMPLGDKFRVAQVCKRWNSIVYDRANWTRLNITDWESTSNHHSKQSEEIINNEIDNNNIIFYPMRDGEEDMDVVENNNYSNTNQPEMAFSLRTLNFWLKFLLPRVGTYIKKLDLHSCKPLTNNTARRILQLCPNVTDLDLSFTNIGDNAFREVRLEKLENLNCEGCENLSDNAFKFILISSTANIFKSASAVTCHDRSSTLNSSLNSHDHHRCEGCVNSRRSIEELHHRNDQQQQQQQQQQEEAITAFIDVYHGSCVDEEMRSDNEDDHEPQSSHAVAAAVSLANTLRSINLSGCWSITDSGLNYIATKYDLSGLKYLNLSGCVNVTSNGMSELTRKSEALRGENLYYCDQIVDGPMSREANGCENVDCATKYCCRSSLSSNYY